MCVSVICGSVEVTFHFLFLEEVQLIIRITQNQTSRELASANTVLIPQ